MIDLNEELYKVKKGEYSSKDIHDNFAIPSELTVTVTLNEYRELVSANAVADKTISGLRNELYDAKQNINSLRTEKEALTKEIAELKIKISDLLMEKNTSPQTDNGEEEGED